MASTVEDEMFEKYFNSNDHASVARHIYEFTLLLHIYVDRRRSKTESEMDEAEECDGTKLSNGWDHVLKAV